MAATITQADTHYTNTVKTLIEYPETGIFSKIFVKDAHTQQNLFCLAAGTTLEEHTSPKNATVMVIEGEGKLTLNGEKNHAYSRCGGLYADSRTTCTNSNE